MLNISTRDRLYFSTPNELKLADITPIFKKEDSTQPKNYRPVKVLPCVPKVFERIIQKQLSEYIEKFYIHFCVVTKKVLVLRKLC